MLAWFSNLQVLIIFFLKRKWFTTWPCVVNSELEVVEHINYCSTKRWKLLWIIDGGSIIRELTIPWYYILLTYMIAFVLFSSQNKRCICLNEILHSTSIGFFDQQVAVSNNHAHSGTLWCVIPVAEQNYESPARINERIKKPNQKHFSRLYPVTRFLPPFRSPEIKSCIMRKRSSLQ
jgi:hypothetical protein